jgi:hypothetical protein
MRLSTIVVSWNTKEILAQCLDSLTAEQIEGGHEILVVDNASTDGSPEFVRERYPEIILLESGENLGFAKANNLALETCTGETILLLNPDTQVLPGALSSLLCFLETHPSAGTCGARLLNPDGTLQFSCSPQPSLRSELQRLLHLPGIRQDGYYPMEDWDVSAPRRVDTLLGACLMVRRSSFEQVGFLDAAFFMYSEEVDLCKRIRQKGWEIYWVPEAKVIHYGGQSTQQAAAKMFLQLYWGKVKYFRKHHGRFSAWLYKLVLFLAGAVRLILFPLAWVRSPEKRSINARLATNYWKLLLALPGM